MEAEEIVGLLRTIARPENIKGMARYGISVQGTLGVPVPELRRMARLHRREHGLALALWETGIHEARMLACFIDDPDQVTEEQMEEWVAALDSWDVCDQLCGNLFDRTQMASRKAVEWAGRSEEYVKRAGFVLMATLAVHDKLSGDESFVLFFSLMAREACDNRPMVRKAVNWALRQIGKRNRNLNLQAIAAAQQIGDQGSPSARWIAADALRELRSEPVQRRLKA